MYFGVCEYNEPFENAILKKKYNKDNANERGDIILVLSPEDTEHLMPGTYYYEIKLLLVNPYTESGQPEIKELNTVTPRTKFVILE